MKKAVLIILLIAVSTSYFFVLTGCSARRYEPAFSEPNLAKGAQITGRSDNPTRAIDGKRQTTVALGQDDFLELDFGEQVTFDTVVLREKGDSVQEFSLSIWQNDVWEIIYIQDRILQYRVCALERTTTSKLQLSINKSTDAVILQEIEVYNTKKQEKDFRVSQYLRMDKDDIVALEGNADFSGYYDVVTDVIIFDTVYFNADATPHFIGGKAAFDANFQALKRIIGNRSVRIWLTVFFDQYSNGAKDYDGTVAFLKKNEKQYLKAIGNLVEEYNLYGIDYDWEYPQKARHWIAYSRIVVKTAKITKVSVASAPWHGFGLGAIKAMHHVNLMTYDIFDLRGDHCNIYVGTVESAAGLLNKGFPKEKLYLGLPFYGRTVNKSEHAWPLYSEDFNLGKWGNFIADYNYDANGTAEVSSAYLNGYAMIRDKTATAIAMGLGGVMIFRAKCDMPYSYEYSLHRAIGEVIEERVSA